jgi:hypothetical protein
VEISVGEAKEEGTTGIIRQTAIIIVAETLMETMMNEVEMNVRGRAQAIRTSDEDNITKLEVACLLLRP